jgi:hypothetical protein
MNSDIIIKINPISVLILFIISIIFCFIFIAAIFGGFTLNYFNLYDISQWIFLLAGFTGVASFLICCCILFYYFVGFVMFLQIHSFNSDKIRVIANSFENYITPTEKKAQQMINLDD